MKGWNGTFLFAILWAMLAWGIFSCDTANNVEDPDMHYFVKYYGGDGNQIGVDMIALNDGSFLLLGNYSESNFDTDIYVVRVDSEGEVIWEKRYRQNPGNIASAKDIEPTGDGNFIILADFQTAIGSQTDLKLIKISPDGTKLDSSIVFGSVEANDYSRTVTVLDDGGFIVSGTTEFTRSFNNPTDPDPDLGNVINYRFDQNLDQFSLSQWSPISPGFNAQLDVAVKTFETPYPRDSAFYVFGYSTGDLFATNPNESLSLFYFKRGVKGGESNNYAPGNIVNVNNTEIQFVLPVAQELGGGFIVIGTSQNNTGLSDIFVAKMRDTLTFNDNDATLYYTIPLGRNIRGVSAANSIIGTSGYLVLGNEVRSTGALKLNIWLTKIDQSGRVIWSSTFGSEAEDDSGAAVCELPDGKIVIFGTMGLADNQSKMALIKLNPRGELLK